MAEDYNIERKIIRTLLEDCQARHSVEALCSQTLANLQSSPLLEKAPAAIWFYDPAFNIEVIATNNTTFDVLSELEKHRPQNQGLSPLSMQVVTFEENKFADFDARLDIHLEQHEQKSYFASFWFTLSTPIHNLLIDLFKQVFGIFNLCFRKIIGENYENNLMTVLEKTGDCVNITEQVKQINQLKISEDRYRNIMNAASDAIFIHDLKGAFVEINDAACKSLGYTREELTKSYVWDIETGVSVQTLNELWQAVQNGPVTLEGEHKRKDGSQFPVEVRLGIFNAIGEKLIMAMVRDISVQRRSEDTIRKLTQALEQSPVLVLITDKTGSIEYANAKVFEQTGYKTEEILGQNARALQSGKTPEATYQAMWQNLLQGKQWQGELLNKNKQGDYFWVSSIISPLRNDGDEITHYLAVMEDITEKKGYEAMLRHQATYDPLTNLPNRLNGHNKLEQAIANARKLNTKLAVLFLDLDEFKNINDSLGHASGDLLLKILSARYQSVIRQTDTLARLGGDEFMMIIENLSHESDAGRIAEKCLEICAQPCMIDSEEILISVSIGIAMYPDNGQSTKTLMRNADTAMYKSKSRGKNNWTSYHEGMEDKATKHIRIKSELNKALIHDELSINYQPIIDVCSNSIIGAEALLRWESPYLGQVPPEQMISIAEETGLIIPLGQWVLQKACMQAREWQKILKKPLTIAVNISALQLKHKDFVNQVKAILKTTGLPPELLVLEITESAFIDDAEFILSQLNELSAMNINCSLDDFGIGYSSLSYIRHLPFKSLKIDKIFIQGIITNVNDLTLVNSIIAMSRNLNLTVIAEGVETIEQLNLIRSMNCQLVQGWLFSKPLPNDKFFSYVKNNEQK